MTQEGHHPLSSSSLLVIRGPCMQPCICPLRLYVVVSTSICISFSRPWQKHVHSLHHSPKSRRVTMPRLPATVKTVKHYTHPHQLLCPLMCPHPPEPALFFSGDLYIALNKIIFKSIYNKLFISFT